MKAILLAALSFCLLGVSNADAHARHHHHHRAVHSAPAVQDYAYPVDDRYAHLNTGEWVYHERGPKALYEWQRRSEGWAAKTTASVRHSGSNVAAALAHRLAWCGLI